MELKKNPESVMSEALSGARTTSIIETMRAKGSSDEEIVDAVMGGEKGALEFAKSIAILLNLKIIGHFYNYDQNENPALLGYAFIVQHYTSHPLAVAFQKFWDKAKTYQDVYDFFCETTEIQPEKIKTFQGFDETWFNEWLKTEFSHVRTFGLNDEHAQALYKEAVPSSTPNTENE